MIVLIEERVYIILGLSAKTVLCWLILDRHLGPCIVQAALGPIHVIPVSDY